MTPVAFQAARSLQFRRERSLFLKKEERTNTKEYLRECFFIKLCGQRCGSSLESKYAPPPAGAKVGGVKEINDGC